MSAESSHHLVYLGYEVWAVAESSHHLVYLGYNSEEPTDQVFLDQQAFETLVVFGVAHFRIKNQEEQS